MLSSYEGLGHADCICTDRTLVALPPLHARLFLLDVLEEILHLSQALDLLELVGLGALDGGGLGEGGHGTRWARSELV